VGGIKKGESDNAIPQFVARRPKRSIVFPPVLTVGAATCGEWVGGCYEDHLLIVPGLLALAVAPVELHANYVCGHV